MSKPRITRRPTSLIPAARRSLRAPTLLICAAGLIAPLLAGVPDERAWTNIVCMLGLIALALVLVVDRAVAPISPPARIARFACASLVAIAILSMAWRIIVTQHGLQQYIDPMMHATGYWAAIVSLCVGAFAVSRGSRSNAYGILVAIVAAAAIASALAVQDYVRNVFVLHTGVDWREFGTSTPDFFAGYLLITIPVTLALFLNAPTGATRRMGWLLAVALALELAALPITGSRFALISLLAEAIVFAGGMALAKSRGLALSRPIKTRLASLGVLVLLGAALVAGPVLHRLEAGAMTAQSNSGAFRIQTWRGALRMAKRFPLLGAGPGMFVSVYPEFAEVGFTRMAHSGYLQTLDDLGPLGDISILALFAACLWAAFVSTRTVRSVSDEEAADGALLDQFAQSTRDDRIVIIGLSAAIGGALVQNAIDSDWYATLCGATLFLAAGVLLGMSDASVAAQSGKRALSPIRLSIAAVAAVLSLACLTWACAGFAYQSGNYLEAAQIEPSSAVYAADLAWKVNTATGDLATAERNLSTAIALAPDPVYYYRRADVYNHSGRPQMALADVASGLRLDPNSLVLLLLGAGINDKIGDHAAALAYYAKMAALQTKPYGTVPALTGVVEYRYAYADEAIGVDAMKGGYPKVAIRYFTIEQSILQSYADEGGSASLMRQAQTGWVADAALDRELQSLYQQVMPQLISSYRAAGNAAAADRATVTARNYYRAFANILRKSSST